MPKKVSLKLSKKDSKSDDKAICCPSTKELYPYGLSITIDEETIAKFPQLKGCAGGERVMIEAESFVKSIRVDTEDPDKIQSMELQFTNASIVKKDDYKAGFEEQEA